MSDQLGDEVSRDSWSVVDVAMFTGVAGLPTVFGPLLLLAAGEWFQAGTMASSSWFIVMFYESTLAEQYKHEVMKRVE